MLTRENIKQAIDVIGRREPEIAYTLNAMLGKGRIDVLPRSDARQEKQPFFFFGGKRAYVNKFQLFSSGTPPLEQALLIHYGEMVQQRTLVHEDPGAPPVQHASKIHTAGLAFMLDYELDLAAEKLEQQIFLVNQKDTRSNDETLVNVLHQRLSRIKGLKKDTGQIEYSPETPWILYQGVVNADTRAYFMRFLFSRQSLIQAAGLNFEFFHIRFLLNCLISGLDYLLFSCIAKQELQGLVFLEIQRKLFYRGFEVKYIATRGGSTPQNGVLPVKGTGTFLMAGVWIIWKSRYPEVKEIFLESEIEAEHFYTTLGFYRRGMCRYVLKVPQERLLTAIVAMTAFSKKKHASIVSSLCRRIPGQIRILKRKDNQRKQRDRALEFIKIALHPSSSDLLARTALVLIRKNRRSIPEGEALITLARAFGRNGQQPGQATSCLPVAVVMDVRYQDHLKGVTTLESFKRLQAVDEVLESPCLEGKWVNIESRLAQKKELTWVHTQAHVEAVEKTAEKTLSSFDVDTQTTKASWSTARLAAGGVFCALDAIMSGRCARGFAFVRPPGHHAGPNKSMGFCIFNNIALGAQYLKHQYNLSKVMIIDIDAHHGNGTQDIFYDTDQVLFVSLHESKSFPGTGRVEEAGTGKGQGFTINVPLEKGSRARDIGRALYFLAGPVAQAYHPDIILVSFGFDLYIHDRLSGMRVTPGGYARITSLLLEIAEKSCGGKILFVLEGGYSMAGIRQCGLSVMKEICHVPGVDTEKTDLIRKSDFSRLSGLKQVRKIHKKYWAVLE